MTVKDLLVKYKIVVIARGARAEGRPAIGSKLVNSGGPVTKDYQAQLTVRALAFAQAINNSKKQTLPNQPIH
jgi:hypothetical protein